MSKQTKKTRSMDGVKSVRVTYKNGKTEDFTYTGCFQNVHQFKSSSQQLTWKQLQFIDGAKSVQINWA